MKLLSIITATILITTNALSWTETQTEIFVGANTDNINENLIPRMVIVESRLDDKDSKDLEHDNKFNLNDVKNISQDAEIDALKNKGFATETYVDNIESDLQEQIDDNWEEILDNWDNIVDNKNRLTTLENNSTDSVQVTTNKNNISDLQTKNVSQDVLINQNINDVNINKNAIQATNLKVDSFSSSITANTNLSQNNRSRLDDKDIKDSQQDSRITQNENDIAELKINNSLNIQESLKRNEKNENKKITASMASDLEYYFLNGDTNSFSMNFSTFEGEVGIGIGYAYRDYNYGSTISVNLGRSGEYTAIKLKANWSF
jgi:hypothetical protein